MTKPQLDSCISLSNGETLCSNIQATYHAQSANNNCELDLFNNAETDRCELYNLQDPTVWHQLDHPNQWVYGTLNKLQLNIVCDKKPLQYQIQNSGLLQIGPTCRLQTEQITIIGHQQIRTSLRSSATNPGLPSDWIEQYKTVNITAKSYVPAINELERIQQQIAQINAAKLPTHAIHTTYHSLAVS